MWLVVGTAAFLIAFRVDHEKWRKLARPVMVITLLLLFAVLIPGVGVEANGASRWIGSSSLQVQPSELAKVALILFAADVLDRRAGKRNWQYQAAPVVIVLLLLGVLVMAQPDMGTTMVLVVISAAILWTAGTPLRPLAGLAGAGTLLACIFAKAAPYRWRRMTAFLHPFKDAVQYRLSVGSGIAGPQPRARPR